MKLADNEDITFIRLALDLASLGVFSAHPNPRVGCVLVKDGKVIGEGLHWQTGSAHAEVNALQNAADVKGATCYVTLEPCAHVGRTPACVDALIEAGVKKVVIACIDPNPQVKGKGIQKLLEAGIEVVVGVLEEQAIALNIGFFSRMIRHRPYVRAKVAMSLDGRVAMASGESQWITGETARKQGHLWRARSGAVLTGNETVLKDNCRLTVRDEQSLGLPEGMVFRQPLRVVVDSSLKVPMDKAIFQQPGKTVVATVKKRQNEIPISNEKREVVVLPEKDGHVDLKALLEWLGEREINDVLVEAGPTLTGVMLQQGLIDEALLYVAPKLLGSDAMPMASLPGFSVLSDHIKGAFTQVEHCGKDLFVVMKISNNEFLT